VSAAQILSIGAGTADALTSAAKHRRRIKEGNMFRKVAQTCKLSSKWASFATYIQAYFKPLSVKEALLMAYSFEDKNEPRLRSSTSTLTSLVFVMMNVTINRS
jgi:hypothetical protein